MYDEILRDLTAVAKQEDGHTEDMARFFKASPGGYGEGDMFLGVTVPAIRLIAKKYASLSTEDVQSVLESPLHEMRLLAVIIMSNQSKKGDDAHKKVLFDQYLANTKYVNNWDIVDASCHDVVARYLLLHPEKMSVLEDLARSPNIWERRIAMVSTWGFIRTGKTDQTYKIADLLLGDSHDLIHKAVGWMLREAGKRNEEQLKAYLMKHHRQMPRTAFRYAIERFSPEERRYFMQLK